MTITLSSIGFPAALACARTVKVWHLPTSGGHYLLKTTKAAVLGSGLAESLADTAAVVDDPDVSRLYCETGEGVTRWSYSPKSEILIIG